MKRVCSISGGIFRVAAAFLLIHGGLSQLCAGEMALSKAGEALFTITVPTDAIPAERTAAAQLQKYLNAVTGADFPIRDEDEVPVDAPQIVVGAGRRAKKLLPKSDWAGLGHDGILIKTVNGNLVLAGGRPRGTLYAVFQFLEDSVGCRWWTPTDGLIPRITDLTIPAQNVRYVPKFSYREHFTTSTRYNPEFATVLKENGSHQQQAEAWGGHYNILGFVHTFSELLPPERYFPEHPGWFTDPARGSLPGTKDSAMPGAQQTQLCLSNPEVLQELTKNALQWISEHPDAGYISISQNDNSAFCRCEGCQEISRREGSESGAILEFVNAVAEVIGRQYPDFWVETLAYTYSEKPPRTVRPAKNVVIRLALALADYGHPMDSEWNKESRDKVSAWAEIAPHLFIWSYATNFKKTMFPHPNWSSLAADLRFFADHNVRGMFVQGDCYTGDVGDFTQLRAWLLGKLLWKPALDQKALTSEFLRGYYGAAGPYLQKYLDLLVTALDSQKRGLNTNNRDFSFLTLNVVNRAAELFRRAREAVAEDKVLLGRVRREELSLTIARIARDRALQTEAAGAGVKYPSREEIAKETVEFVRAAEEYGLQQWGENVTLEEGLAELRRTAAPIQVELPAFAKDVARRDAIDFQPRMMTLALEGSLTFIENDPAASGGLAAVMMTNSHDWLVQAQLGPYLDVAGEEWRIYAVVRSVERPGASPQGTALEGGIFTDSDMKHIARFVLDFSQFSEPGYSVIDLGSHKLTPGMLIWFAPHSPDHAEKFLFDRILLLHESAAKKLTVKKR